MHLPNLYAGDYRRLVVIPLVLFVLSLFAIFWYPGLPAGIEIRGGVEITAQTTRAVDAESLVKDIRQRLTIDDVGVEQNTNPTGGITLRVQLEQNKHLARAEKELEHFYRAYDAVTNYSLIISLGELNKNRTAAEAEELQRAKDAYARAFADMNASANYILGLTGKTFNETASFREMKESVEDGYLQAKQAYKERIMEILRSHTEITSYSFRDVTPSLSESFIASATNVVIISSLLVAIVVFLIFRSAIPSLQVLLGALFDIAFALGLMSVFRVPITLPSFAALLMIMGYSLDTDVFLSMRVLQRDEKTARARAYDAFKTGLTMNTTALTSFSVLFLLSLVSHIPTYYQISTVILFGVLGDVCATWALNAPLVLMYAESLEAKASQRRMTA